MRNISNLPNVARMGKDDVATEHVRIFQSFGMILGNKVEVTILHSSAMQMCATDDGYTVVHKGFNLNVRTEWSHRNLFCDIFDSNFGPLTRHTQAPSGSPQSSHPAWPLPPAARAIRPKAAASFPQRARHRLPVLPHPRSAPVSARSRTCGSPQVWRSCKNPAHLRI